ncbi:UDP-GlcNAc:betaGal beta-1,3-N-acetylglucosaminyltransferase-like protein 1 [Galendromus occidentalis]|uniref:UDP-GlcNAc:betaGal beta-1,3-N-acetylglucosaminyltransferase-like protein 1 n=1 Tax=Galendromus occidentalis TaxID=34638 RepID=A0AAJ6QV23_9ACAR|nr:UDP-GlcNAc:betaGal beta-1,3-N-acetylglucosaminyltransferase-like protein 1 [Galendromus occidentalis]
MGDESEKATEPGQGQRLISIIVPVHNGEKFLNQCFDSILNQDFPLREVEVSVWNDGSTDASASLIESQKVPLERAGIKLISGSESGPPRGCGYAKNRAIEQCSGRYLCFLDADDEMLLRRLAAQLCAAQENPRAIVGSRFHREPPDSTVRYSRWANDLPAAALETQIYTSHGPTVIMPTWFCSRETYEAVGAFSEAGRGTPEDLIFFYRHLDLGGRIVRVDEDLLMYRYHPHATTFSILEETIWNIRLQRLQQKVLSKWSSFTIWNAGKQGRRFYRTLNDENRRKVVAFCDVDAKKISKGIYIFEESATTPKPRIPIIHFSHAKAPLVICVKIDLTGGGLEENLASLHLEEGQDYIHFA